MSKMRYLFVTVLFSIQNVALSGTSATSVQARPPQHLVETVHDEIKFSFYTSISDYTDVENVGELEVFLQSSQLSKSSRWKRVGAAALGTTEIALYGYPALTAFVLGGTLTHRGLKMRTWQKKHDYMMRNAQRMESMLNAMDLSLVTLTLDYLEKLSMVFEKLNEVNLRASEPAIIGFSSLIAENYNAILGFQKKATALDSMDLLDWIVLFCGAFEIGTNFYKQMVPLLKPDGLLTNFLKSFDPPMGSYHGFFQKRLIQFPANMTRSLKLGFDHALGTRLPSNVLPALLTRPILLILDTEDESSKMTYFKMRVWNEKIRIGEFVMPVPYLIEGSHPWNRKKVYNQQEINGAVENALLFLDEVISKAASDCVNILGSLPQE